MQVTDSQKIVTTISRFDLAGGMNLFDVNPTWKDSKFVAYPYFLRQVPLYREMMHFRNVKFILLDISSYKRIKGVYRFIYLTEKFNKGECENAYFRSHN